MLLLQSNTRNETCIYTISEILLKILFKALLPKPIIESVLLIPFSIARQNKECNKCTRKQHRHINL